MFFLFAQGHILEDTDSILTLEVGDNTISHYIFGFEAYKHTNFTNMAVQFIRLLWMEQKMTSKHKARTVFLFAQRHILRIQTPF